jgi:hypothetical protein
MFLGLPDLDSDPLVRGMDPDPAPAPDPASNPDPLSSIPTVLWLLLDFLSLKNDVNVPSKSNKQKFFFLN